jgi:type II secretory pathway component GspD/PulD (secretin)
MKHYFSVFTDQPIVFTIILFLAIFFLMLPIASSAGNKTNAGDELISLTVKDEPLGDVLYKVSMATGYDISLDDKWQNYRVTASFEEISLHKGLKRILKDLNSAIIYVSNKKIKIIIYDKTDSEGASYTTSDEKPLDRAPVSQRQSYRPLRQRHPLPTSQDIEKEDSSGTDDESSDTPIVSDQESETSTLDSKGEEKTKPESLISTPNEGTDKNLEVKSTEDSSYKDDQSESKNE